MKRALGDIESWTIDYERHEYELRTRDGQVIHWRASSWPTSDPQTALDFKRVTYRPAQQELRMVTPWDEELEVEVFANDDQALRRSGRPVVYLDQDKWVQIAQAIHRPERVHAPELDPTLRLIDLARAPNVVLPLSSGHAIETVSTYGERRSHLAAEMIGLSRGWIMRDPLLVRASELSALFAKTARNTNLVSTSEPVFTLDTTQLSAERPRPYVPRGPGLAPELVDLISTVSGAQAVLAVLLENERTKSPEGVEAATNWADGHQKFSKHLTTEAARPYLRALTLRRFLTDLGVAPAEAARDAGLTPSDFGTWLESRADQEVSSLPYLGRKREVIHRRLMNPQDVWKANDLIDMLFLPCAAGYADYVVCEKKTGHHLQYVERQQIAPSGAAVFTSMRDLVAALDKDGTLSTTGSG